jgi:hypothetical protein
MIHDFNVFFIADNKFKNRILLSPKIFKKPFLIMPAASV